MLVQQSLKAAPRRSKKVELKAAASSARKQQGWHQIQATEVFRLLDVDVKTGLSSDEARLRQKKYGLNAITRRPGKSAWLKFLDQFNQPLVYILLLATVVTAFVGEYVDSTIIFAVILINAIVGFLQEAKAEKAIESLSGMVATEANVRRDARNQRLRSELLVPGDIVLLQSGDRVPADLRLFHARGLQIDESALTGESVPVQKDPQALALDTVLADRRNLAFAGTLVTAGQGEGIVWATGDQTETGHIADLISQALDISTPLTKKITHFSHLLLWVILVLSAAAFGIGVARGENAVQMFMASVALAVGAIPEGLPAAVTIVLAIGVSRMARRKAIIRKLPAVETLGSTTVICSDKTGTLTENQMTVREIYAGGKLYEVSGSGYQPAGEIRANGKPAELREGTALVECLRAGVLCNDSELLNEDGRLKVQGDPTEAALLVVGEKAGLLRASMHSHMPRLDVIPFESEQMYRATLHVNRAARVIYKIGAVERLLGRCADALDERGALVPLDKEAVQRAVESMARRGLRVLAFARRHVQRDHATLEHAHVSEGLTFLGLQGMIDPPRKEAIEAVRKCQEAGIAVKMITGDHLVTAQAIAGQIGLKGSAEHGTLVALTGRDLEKISDEQLPELAASTAVFARVAPEQKLRLVRALQSRGHVVAMTGDGVNDAPALKQADIGVAMGITGTDVSKGAAAMILTDDNFATIEAAVEEGRGVFDNLTKFIVWTLPTNGGEALILLTAILFGIVLPALPVQLLWVNMTSAVLLGLMLVFEPREPGLMQRPPRDPKRPLLTYPLLMRTGLVSLMMLAGAYWLFFWELSMAGETIAEARTAVINVIVMVEVGYLFNCRTLNRTFFSIGLFTNRWAIVGALTMILAQLAFTYVPLMNRLFQTAPISPESWLRILLVAAAVFSVVEIEKWIRFGRAKSQEVVPE
ncbi:MAG TPA: cation-transporting P-type ATPase [Planctomycetota bacterium]|nr:cation-transporting P-type ATPase [Planctomycetota bacterium]